MATITAVTRFIGNGSPTIITVPAGDSSKCTVLIITDATDVYVGGSVSMGAGSSFPATITDSGGIYGYPLTPGKEYTFVVTAVGGTEGDNLLAVTTSNPDGVVISYLVLQD